MAWPVGGGNPYQALLYRELAARGWQVTDYSLLRLVALPVDVVHLHWPDLVLLEPRRRVRTFKAVVILALLSVARLRRRAVVWTVHNPYLRAEQGGRCGRLYLRLVARACSGLIFLSEDHVEAYGDIASRKATAVIRQPSYRLYYGAPRDRREAKRRVGVDPDDRVLGFFGFVRPYKNVGSLAAAFRDVRDPRTRLLIAGEFAEPCRGLVGALRRDPRVVVLNQRIPDDEVPSVLAAIDVVVLPYRELGNSAVALLALAYGRPILAPCAASIRELRSAVGDDWVRIYTGELRAADLERALAFLPRSGEPRLEDFDPKQIGRLSDRFLSTLVDRGSRARVSSGRDR